MYIHLLLPLLLATFDTENISFNTFNLAHQKFVSHLPRKKAKFPYVLHSLFSPYSPQEDDGNNNTTRLCQETKRHVTYLSVSFICKCTF